MRSICLMAISTTDVRTCRASFPSYTFTYNPHLTRDKKEDPLAETRVDYSYWNTGSYMYEDVQKRRKKRGNESVICELRQNYGRYVSGTFLTLYTVFFFVFESR